MTRKLQEDIDTTQESQKEMKRLIESSEAKSRLMEEKRDQLQHQWKRDNITGPQLQVL